MACYNVVVVTKRLKGLKHISGGELATYSYRSASNIRAERRHKAVKTTQKVARQPFAGFTDFLRTNAVIGLAVGFLLGSQVQIVVKQIIASFVQPLFQLLFPGNKELDYRTFTLHFNGRSANFGWGLVVGVLINFLFVTLFVYLIIRALQLDKFHKK